MIELNKIYNEDCLIGMQRIPDKSIDAIICDLPFGTTDCRWDSIIPFEPLWEQYNRVIKDNGAIVLFGSQPFTTMLIQSNIKNFKYEWIWIKNTSAGFIHAKNMPLKKHENILVFSNAPMGHKSLLNDKRMSYNPQGLIEKKTFYKLNKTNCVNVIGKRPSQKNEFESEYINYPTSILDVKKSSNDKFKHPTQKPVALIEYLIKTYTNEGETVLDNCMGSGTTAIACLNTNRNFIGFEMDKGYFDIANERIEKHIIELKQKLF